MANNVITNNQNNPQDFDIVELPRTENKQESLFKKESVLLPNSSTRFPHEPDLKIGAANPALLKALTCEHQWIVIPPENDLWLNPTSASSGNRKPESYRRICVKCMAEIILPASSNNSRIIEEGLLEYIKYTNQQKEIIYTHQQTQEIQLNIQVQTLTAEVTLLKQQLTQQQEQPWMSAQLDTSTSLAVLDSEASRWIKLKGILSQGGKMLKEVAVSVTSEVLTSLLKK